MSVSLEKSPQELLNTHLAQWLHTTLKYPLEISLVKNPAPDEIWTKAERDQLTQWQDKTRQTEWQRGKIALKQLLRALGDEPDTSAIQFPNRRFSLSHSTEYTIAIGLTESRDEVFGIGIDMQLYATLLPTTEHLFLTKQERAWHSDQPLEEQEENRLRLWTIKEACFKADPLNHKRFYTDFQVNLPFQPVGQAMQPDSPQSIYEYASCQLLGGFLSVAIHTHIISPILG